MDRINTEVPILKTSLEKSFVARFWMYVFLFAMFGLGAMVFENIKVPVYLLFVCVACQTVYDVNKAYGNRVAYCERINHVLKYDFKMSQKGLWIEVTHIHPNAQEWVFECAMEYLIDRECICPIEKTWRGPVEYELVHEQLADLRRFR